MNRHIQIPSAPVKAVLTGIVLVLASLENLAAQPMPADKSTVIPATQLQFYKNKDGLTFANGWGDPTNGPHSNYIKLDGDSASPLHTHSASYYGVVISGVVANEPTAAAKDRPLPAGSYWYQKGNEPHVTKCISHEPCLIFVTSQRAFDIHVVSEVQQKSRFAP